MAIDDGRFWIGAGAVALAALVAVRRGSSSRARTVPIGEAGWTFPVSKRIAERFEVLTHQIKVWEPKVDALFEAGQTDEAEDLDARLEAARQELANLHSELEQEAEAPTSWGTYVDAEPSVDESLVSWYERHLAREDGLYGGYLDDAERAETRDYWAKALELDYGMQPMSGDEAMALAKRIWEKRKDLRAKLKAAAARRSGQRDPALAKLGAILDQKLRKQAAEAKSKARVSWQQRGATSHEPRATSRGPSKGSRLRRVAPEAGDDPVDPKMLLRAVRAVLDQGFSHTLSDFRAFNDSVWTKLGKRGIERGRVTFDDPFQVDPTVFGDGFTLGIQIATEGLLFPPGIASMSEGEGRRSAETWFEGHILKPLQRGVGPNRIPVLKDTKATVVSVGMGPGIHAGAGAPPYQVNEFLVLLEGTLDDARTLIAYAESLAARKARGSPLRRVAPEPEPEPSGWRAWKDDPRIPPSYASGQWQDKSPSGNERRIEWYTPVGQDLRTMSNAADSTTPLVWVVQSVRGRGFAVSFQRIELGRRLPLVVYVGRDGRRTKRQVFLRGPRPGYPTSLPTLTWQEAVQVAQWAALRLVGPSLTYGRWEKVGQLKDKLFLEYKTPLSLFRVDETPNEVMVWDELYKVSKGAGKASMFYPDWDNASLDAMLRYDKAVDAVVARERKR